MAGPRRQVKIWIQSFSADSGLRHASKVHPKAFFSINSRDLQYQRWLQELSKDVSDTPLALYIKCTRFVDLAKAEDRGSALQTLPFIFLHYMRESKGWTVPQPSWPVLNLIAFDWKTANGSQMVIPHAVPSRKALDEAELRCQLTELCEGLKAQRPELLPAYLA